MLGPEANITPSFLYISFYSLCSTVYFLYFLFCFVFKVILWAVFCTVDFEERQFEEWVSAELGLFSWGVFNQK